VNKIKILQFPIANSKGGITNYILQNWKYIDKTKFRFDFATMSHSLDFAEELEEQGCKIYHISCYAEDNKEKFVHEFRNILNNEDYDVVHLHTKQWKSFLVERIAKEMGIKKIIIHAHSTGIDVLDKNTRRKELQLHNQTLENLTEDVATDFWACSQEAADFIFGDKISKQKIQIMRNAIELSKYVYNPQIRYIYRKSLKIEDDEFVIGNVGRFVYQKNQEFLIKVFAEIKDLERNKKTGKPKYKLLLVGAGEREQEYREMVKEYEIEQSVIFTGYRTDIPELLQAMDIFCLPSRFEGLPISLIEAQASGLVCLANETITKEANITGRVYYYKTEVERWVGVVLNLSKKNLQRAKIYEGMLKENFDITQQIKVLEQGYEIGK